MGSSSVQTRGETATYCRYCEKGIENAGILGLLKQFGNRPHVIRKPCFHAGVTRKLECTRQNCVAGLISGHPIALARVPCRLPFLEKLD